MTRLEAIKQRLAAATNRGHRHSDEPVTDISLLVKVVEAAIETVHPKNLEWVGQNQDLIDALAPLLAATEEAPRAAGQ